MPGAQSGRALRRDAVCAVSTVFVSFRILSSFGSRPARLRVQERLSRAGRDERDRGAEASPLSTRPGVGLSR